MLTGFNFEMAFGFITINIIADITLKLIKQDRVQYFVDFIFESKQDRKLFFLVKNYLQVENGKRS